MNQHKGGDALPGLFALLAPPVAEFCKGAILGVAVYLASKGYSSPWDN